MEEIKRMVLGFVFSEDLEEVLLIQRKNAKQAWQNGRDNGLGGKIEAGESAVKAMQREFEEESGYVIDGWVTAGSMGGRGWNVEIFGAKTNLIPRKINLETREGWVRWVACNQLPETIIDNLAVFIPLLRYKFHHPEFGGARFDFEE
ncbi:NUDIX domain-containing protein [Patescibacteria group bacterium]|nr:NUDIX domain-containing protein [Patescibacteria group bacterium]